MSAGVAIARIHELRNQPWPLWWRQVRAVLRKPYRFFRSAKLRRLWR